MSRISLENRLTALESQVAELRAELQKLVQPKDWRSVVGMFAGDEEMKSIFEEGRKIREAERRQARKKQTKTRQRTAS